MIESNSIECFEINYLEFKIYDFFVFVNNPNRLKKRIKRKTSHSTLYSMFNLKAHGST